MTSVVSYLKEKVEDYILAMLTNRDSQCSVGFKLWANWTCKTLMEMWLLEFGIQTITLIWRCQHVELMYMVITLMFWITLPLDTMTLLWSRTYHEYNMECFRSSSSWSHWLHLGNDYMYRHALVRNHVKKWNSVVHVSQPNCVSSTKVYQHMYDNLCPWE